MQDIRDLYILCEPIETRIGKLHFLKVKEYPKLLRYVPYLLLQKNEIIDKIKEFDYALADYLLGLQMVKVIKLLKGTGMYESYKELFQLCFKDDVFDLVEYDEEFEYYRDLIKKINCIEAERPNPNPEIERFNRYKRYLQFKKGEAITFESVYTSVWTVVGQRPSEMYIYEMYALFNRIAQFKQYDTNILWSTISKEVKVEPWYKHIDILKKNEHGIRTNMQELLASQGNIT